MIGFYGTVIPADAVADDHAAVAAAGVAGLQTRQLRHIRPRVRR